MTGLKSWIRDNSALVYFLIAQAIAIGAAGVSIIAYSVRLERSRRDWGSHLDRFRPPWSGKVVSG